MRWKYVYPDENGNLVEKTMTRSEILHTFYPYWAAKMAKIGKQDLISEDLCVEDWVIVHWACEVP